MTWQDINLDEQYSRYAAVCDTYYYVSSSVSGYRKPNCRGLQMISEKFATPVEELIFVGDEEKDRKTAYNANCKFIWIRRTKKQKEGIDNLCEL